MPTALEHAQNSLIGLSVADALGGFFEFMRGGQDKERIATRTVPDAEWHYTDDTEMALSIYRQLRLYGDIRQDELAESFAEHFSPSRGYGMGARKLLKQVSMGASWREVALNMFERQGSFGNGGAMRIAPLGAYFADDMDAVIGQAKRATEVTHAHPEGVAGGIAVAVAAAVAVQTIDDAAPSIADFFAEIIPHIPDSDVKTGCERAATVATDTPIDEVGKILGNGRQVSAMDTVPVALWSAARWFDDFEEGFWQLASIGGDVDTTCAIMGGVISSRSIASIPDDWIAHREALPDWALHDDS